MGRSRGCLTSKIHAVVDTHGLPVHLALTPGETMTIGGVRFSSAPCFHANDPQPTCRSFG
jgi:hypothetical protein